MGFSLGGGGFFSFLCHGRTPRRNHIQIEFCDIRAGQRRFVIFCLFQGIIYKF